MFAANRLLLTVAVSLVGVLLVCGCHREAPVDAQSQTVRQQVFAAQSPGPALTIADARLAVLDAASSGKPAEVIIAGVIDANGHDPWEKDQSAFVVMDASEEYIKVAKAHNHDDGDCPFCKHKSEPSQFMAVVNISGPDGQILPRSAKTLLGLGQKQTVTVKGEAKINEQNMLVVTAKSIHVVK